MWKFLSASEPKAHLIAHPIEISNFDKAEISYHRIVIKYKSWKFLISHDKRDPWMIISWCDDFWVTIEKEHTWSYLNCERRFITYESALDFVKDFINNELQ